MSGKTYEVPAEMRDLAEKSVEQAKKAFDGFMGAAVKTVDSLQSSQSNVRANAAEMTQKAFGYVGDNVTAAFDLAQQMVRAKDAQEVLALQASFMKHQMEAFQRQVRELGGDFQKAAQDTARAAQDTAKAAAKPKKG